MLWKIFFSQIVENLDARERQGREGYYRHEVHEERSFQITFDDLFVIHDHSFVVVDIATEEVRKYVEQHDPID